MNPYLRIALRALAVGFGVALGSLVSSGTPLDLAAVLQALYLGYGGVMTYAGLGAFTTLEPTLGIQK